MDEMAKCSTGKEKVSNFKQTFSEMNLHARVISCV